MYRISSSDFIRALLQQPHFELVNPDFIVCAGGMLDIADVDAA